MNCVDCGVELTWTNPSIKVCRKCMHRRLEELEKEKEEFGEMDYPIPEYITEDPYYY